MLAKIYDVKVQKVLQIKPIARSICLRFNIPNMGGSRREGLFHRRWTHEEEESKSEEKQNKLMWSLSFAALLPNFFLLLPVFIFGEKLLPVGFHPHLECYIGDICSKRLIFFTKVFELWHRIFCLCSSYLRK